MNMSIPASNARYDVSDPYCYTTLIRPKTNQRILVTGATGNQGSAVIRALFDLNDSSLEILALTRDTNSPRAQKLSAKHPGLKLIPGDYSNPSAIFLACGGIGKIDKIFLVSTPPGFPPNAKVEEEQGKALIDAAIEYGVRVFVQTTVDRGPLSETNATEVPHFISKFHIEKHLLRRKEERKGEGMSYTILRPTVFMENFSGAFMTKVMATALRDGLPPHSKIQLVSAKDIGFFGAQALVHSDLDLHRNQSISLAGDELSVNEMGSVYEDVYGRALPTTWSVVPWALGWVVEGLPKTVRSFRVDGFSADVEGLRAVHPGLKSFRMWLTEREAEALV